MPLSVTCLSREGTLTSILQPGRCNWERCQGQALPFSTFTPLHSPPYPWTLLLQLLWEGSGRPVCLN